jgi:hemolysin activation/secretion protein
MKKFIKIFLPNLILTPFLHAQISTNPDIQKTIQLQDQTIIQQHKLLDRTEQEREQLLKERPKENYQVTPPSDVTPNETLPKFKIDHIIIQGNTVLSKKELQKHTLKYQGTSIDQNEIAHLIKTLTTLYLNKGYITSRAYIQPQNLASGTLTISILEGKVSQIITDTPNDTARLAMAFPKIKGKVLNIHTIDQGLDQLNRNQSRHYTMTLAPDETLLGASIINLTHSSASPYQVQLSYDNIKKTQFYPRQIVAAKEDILTISDTWQVAFSQESGQFDSQNQSVNVSLSFPYRWLTLSTSHTQFDYSQLINGQSRNFLSSGSTKTSTLGIDWTLYRNKSSKLSLTTDLTIRDTTSYIEDTKSDAGSRTLSTLALGIQAESRNRFGLWTLSTTAFRGLSSFGATQDTITESGYPRAQFQRYKATLSGYTPLSLYKVPLTYRLTCDYQYSPHTLFGSEQIAIGDEYSVRGYKFGAIQGDTGGYIKQDLSLPLSSILPTHTLRQAALRTNLTLSTGLDAGFTHRTSTIDDNYVIGALIGLSATLGTTSLSCGLGMPISASQSAGEYHSQLYIRGTVQLL